MYYNKNLFIEERIKDEVIRLEKKQLVSLLVIIASTLLLCLGALIYMIVFFNGEFPCAYLIPALAALSFAVLTAVIAPLSKRIGKCRIEQTEQLVKTVYGQKYAALLQTCKSCQKINYAVLCAIFAISFSASLALSIVFPYEYYSYLGFLLPLLILGGVAMIVLKRVHKKAVLQENDLIDFFDEQYEAAIAAESSNAQMGESDKI